MRKRTEALIVGAAIPFAAILGAGRAAGRTMPSSDKQATASRYAAERAAGARRPAPRDPDPVYPVVPDAPFNRGIIDDPSGPFSSSQIRISNQWEGLIHGRETAVYAGVESPD